jgi:hypothetical protein
MVSTIRTVLLLCFTIGSLGNITLCQTKAAYHLTGIKSVSVLTDGVDSHPCGISQTDVTTSVKFIIGQSNLQISDTSDYAIYVNITVKAKKCDVAYVAVQLLAPATVDGTGVVVPVTTIWDTAQLLGGRSNFRNRVLSEIENECKQLVVDWNSVNKP